MRKGASSNGSCRGHEADMAPRGFSGSSTACEASASSPRRLPTKGGSVAAPAVSSLQPAIRMVMMPRDANYLGTIFGGVILSSLDLAGAVEAHRHSDRKLVTAAMHEVKFIAPVFVGDLVSFYTRAIKVGRTSITVLVTV